MESLPLPQAPEPIRKSLGITPTDALCNVAVLTDNIGIDRCLSLSVQKEIQSQVSTVIEVPVIDNTVPEVLNFKNGTIGLGVMTAILLAYGIHLRKGKQQAPSLVKGNQGAPENVYQFRDTLGEDKVSLDIDKVNQELSSLYNLDTGTNNTKTSIQENTIRETINLIGDTFLASPWEEQKNLMSVSLAFLERNTQVDIHLIKSLTDSVAKNKWNTKNIPEIIKRVQWLLDSLGLPRDEEKLNAMKNLSSELNTKLFALYGILYPTTAPQSSPAPGDTGSSEGMV